MKKRFRIIFFVFIFSMLLSIVFTVSRTSGMLNERIENDQRIETGLISNAITNEFLRPITVSETMSKEAALKSFLRASTKDVAAYYENDAALYLDSIKNGFCYSMVFAVGDKTKCYYTSDGISRYIDETLDTTDVWYTNFLASNKPYVLDVDTDITNNWALSVFINTAVYDNNNELLGVCGVGTEMTKLQELLTKYESIYDVKINLVNKDGLIQIDTDTSRIETESLDIKGLERYADGECYFELRDDGNRTIKYLEDLDWYLVVQNNKASNTYLYEIIGPSLICLVLGLVIAISLYVIKKDEE